MGCWDNIFRQNRTTALVLTKRKVPKIPSSNSKSVDFGAYLIRDCGSIPDAILISSGSDLTNAYIIANKLAVNGINLNVVSIPSLELFLSQS